MPASQLAFVAIHRTLSSLAMSHDLALVRITLAQAMGTCFGVQDAIDLALQEEFSGKLTIVGQLVHNPQVMERLKANGVKIVERHQIDQITTQAVMITAHGASDGTKRALEEKGFTVFDATCPLVIRLHKLARYLERLGYFPVVIGEESHVEVRGVVGNLAHSVVIRDLDDLHRLAGKSRIGIVSQTTNRLSKVLKLVEGIKSLPGVTDVRFIDTICQPVKERQDAIQSLLAQDIDLGIVIGGLNSANTAKLRELIADRGIEAYHVETSAGLDARWFKGKSHIGITAGTSTPQDVIESVHAAARSMAGHI